MNNKIQCNMNGKYRVDIFSGETFIKTTDWFSNNITNTGMLYPFTYPFARCFMFLSLGSGNVGGLNVDSTFGLNGYTGFNTSSGSQPIISFNDELENVNSGQYMGYEYYSTGGALTSASCGTRFNQSGLDMFRAWNVPSGKHSLDKDMTINAFMVSPSSGSDQIGCYAFSIVNQLVSIPSGYNAVIYYQLSLNFPDYVNPQTTFTGGSGLNGYFNTGSANVDSLVSGWSNLSGIYRQLFPGIQMVDNWGACVPTIFDYQMEPSLVDSSNLYFYLSPDISEYAVSKYAGGTGILSISQERRAYNSNGLGANYNEFNSYLAATSSATRVQTITNTSAPGGLLDTYYYSGDSIGSINTSTPVPLNDTDYNIHLQNIISLSGYNTQTSVAYNSLSPTGITGNTVAYASQGVTLYDVTQPDFGQQAVFSTSLRRMPITMNTGLSSGAANYIRKQKSTKFCRFSPLQSAGWNSRYGTLVLAAINSFTTPTPISAYPYMEYLFFDTSGRAANMPHYRIIPEIYLMNRGTGVIQSIFSITGNGINGGSGSPIQRFWNVTGFMDGYYAANSSGINPTGYYTGLFDPNYLSDDSGYSSMPVGILFSGANIPSNLSGNNVVGNYGYGAVYGVVVPNSGFYNLPYDCCLLDNPVCSGFSGDQGFGTLPNPTGETGLLCWPWPGSNIGLSITGMEYYSPSFGIFSDGIGANEVFAYGNNYQLINDITYTGASILNNLSGSNNNSILFTGAGGYSIKVNLLTGSSKKITGYTLNSTFNMGSGSGWTAGIISSMTGFSQVGTLSGSAGAITFPNSSLVLSPTNFCKPSGMIHHVEYFTGDNFTGGFRLLPNYASGNNNWLSGNFYTPIRGGSFPGLSLENGMQLYFDFIWSA